MTNLAAGVLDIINNPMSHGFGAGIQQAKPTTKTQPTKTATISQQTTAKKNTIQAVLEKKTTGISSNIQNVLQSSVPASGNQAPSLDALVSEILNTSIEKKLRDDIHTGKLSLKQDDLNKTYATAVEYYKKIYDNSLSMTELRNKTEKKISDLMNKRISDKISSLQANIPGIDKIVLPQSKLAQSLQATVSKEIHTAIGSLVSSQMISGINNTLLQNLTKISGNINTVVNTQFKSNIESLVKVRSIVQEKIVAFMELKKVYEQKISDAIKSLTSKIGEAMQQFTQKLVDSLAGSVKSLVSGIKLA